MAALALPVALAQSKTRRIGALVLGNADAESFRKELLGELRQSESFRRSAVFVIKLLQGSKPADLPVEQPTKFELVINLKTAKMLGVTVPTAMLSRADEAIN